MLSLRLQNLLQQNGWFSFGKFEKGDNDNKTYSKYYDFMIKVLAIRGINFDLGGVFLKCIGKINRSTCIQ